MAALRCPNVHSHDRNEDWRNILLRCQSLFRVYTRYTHAHHVPHAEHVERSDEMVKCSRDYVEDFEDVSGMLSSACPVHSSVSEVKPRF